MVELMPAARIWRTADEKRKIERDIEALRTAFLAELEIVRDAMKTRAEDVEVNSAYVPRRVLSEFYTQNISKIGILDSDEIKTIMHTYGTYYAFMDSIELISTISEAHPNYFLVDNASYSTFLEMKKSIVATLGTATERLDNNLTKLKTR
jgi:hypothetical protein